MKRKKKQKRQPMYLIIAEAIKEKGIFSITIENESGFKTIVEIVTFYLLRDYSERDRLNLFGGLLPQVKRSFNAAIEHLEENGIPVYKYAEKGKRNLEFITVRKSYRKAQKRDTARGVLQVKTKMEKTVKHIKLANPTALPEFKQKLLGGRC